MAPGLNQPVTEINNSKFPSGKGGRFVGLSILPPLCLDYLAIWEPQTPGTLSVCPGV